MNRTYIKSITKFLKEAYTSCNKGHNGCWHLYLANGLHLVAAAGDNEIVAKLAYNCDDLQCDYQLDWMMPYYTNGEVAYTELALSKGNFRRDAEWFYKEFKAMAREIKAGNLICK